MDLLNFHSDEPQLWQKFLKHFDFPTEQRLLISISILRLTNYLVKHSSGDVLKFYESLSEEANEILERYKSEKDLSEDQIVFYRKFLHEKWSKWDELKKWLLTTSYITQN